MEVWLGVTFVVLGGLVAGSHPWPFKIMHERKFEYWFFVFMIVGCILLSWAITLARYPQAISAYRSVNPLLLMRSNLFALCWAVATLLPGNPSGPASPALPVQLSGRIVI